MAGASGGARGGGPGGLQQADSQQDDPLSGDDGKDSGIECAICLQASLFPVKLPCNHIFCFLCVKGISLQSKRCAMCRQEIPEDYIFNPVLVNPKEEEESKLVIQETEGDEYQWFYKGRQGWWQYDLRTSREIENHHKNGDRRCELLIAGYLYVIDFEYMLQYRRNDPSRRRQVKRDKATQPKKGVAGLRLGGVDNCDNTGDQSEDGDSNPTDGETATVSSRDAVTSAVRNDVTPGESQATRAAVSQATRAVARNSVTQAAAFSQANRAAARNDASPAAVRTAARNEAPLAAVVPAARTAVRVSDLTTAIVRHGSPSIITRSDVIAADGGGEISETDSSSDEHYYDSPLHLPSAHEHLRSGQDDTLAVTEDLINLNINNDENSL